MQQFHAALDLSGIMARFSVSDASGKAVLNAALAMKKRDSAQLSTWMLGKLAETGIALDSITEWTAGAGPGSFTGMRLAAALIAGMTYGKSGIRTRTAPTALALAAQCPVAAGRLVLLYDGRNQEVLLLEIDRTPKGDTLVSEGRVLDHDGVQQYFSEYAAPAAIVVQETEQEAVLKVTGEVLAPERLTVVADYDLQILTRPEIGEFNNKLQHLIYIRPAVFTAPVI